MSDMSNCVLEHDSCHRSCIVQKPASSGRNLRIHFSPAVQLNFNLVSKVLSSSFEEVPGPSENIALHDGLLVLKY